MRLGGIQILENYTPSLPVMSVPIEFDENERYDIPRILAEMSHSFVGGVAEFATPDNTIIDQHSPVEEQNKYLSGNPPSGKYVLLQYKPGTNRETRGSIPGYRRV